MLISARHAWMNDVNIQLGVGFTTIVAVVVAASLTVFGVK